ncbi:MAG: ankyrin repeat domain-containing protein [Candidatus Manganitrophus sp.]|nr:ankyrin repeat domain-containing protein [Candidatus Manganitrophus sp.]
MIAAATHGHMEIVSLLIARGAQIDAADDMGKTALVHARERGHREIVHLLMSAEEGAGAGGVESGEN